MYCQSSQGWTRDEIRVDVSNFRLGPTGRNRDFRPMNVSLPSRFRPMRSGFTIALKGSLAKLVDVLIVSAAAVGALQAQSYRFGRVWDGEKVLIDAVIVVDGGRIVSVGPSGGDAIDMTRYTAVPGLIDAHTHITFVLASTMSLLTQAGRSAATVYLSQDSAKKTLETGVTTVRNLNAQDYQDIAMRDLINAGLMVGPRMFVSAYGLHITRGSTTDPGTADGPAELMKAVRRQVAAGVDVIKMFGSTGSGQDVTGLQTFTYEEMKAAVDTAHALGKKLAIHTYGPTGARDAVRAGADSVEHATDMDESTSRKWRRRKSSMCRRLTTTVTTSIMQSCWAFPQTRRELSTISSLATSKPHAGRSRLACALRWGRMPSGPCSGRTPVNSDGSLKLG